MAWTLPTAAEVKVEYPGLAAVDDAAFTSPLAMAGEQVSQGLPSQVIFTRAASLYVAHDLTVKGYGKGVEAELAASGAMGLQSSSDGSSSFTRRADSGDNNPMGQTTFGQQYLALIRQYILPFGVST